MAELAAVGIASNIIQLVDFTAKVTVRIFEFYNSAGDVPQSFRHINAELSVLKYTVTQLHRTFKSDIIDPTTQNTLEPVLSECNNVLTSLTGLLKRTLPNDADSKGKKTIKALESIINSSEVHDLIKRLRQLTRGLVDASMTVRSFENSNLAKLRKWVKGFDTVDPSRFRWSNERTHTPGTGAWFVRSKQYESWLRDARSLLWLHGMPGRGKSVLSSTVLQRIHNLQWTEPGIAVAYFFFSFKVEASRDPDNLILSLITQLAPQGINLPEDFERLHTSCGNGTFRPPPPVALRLLWMILACLPEVFIVLDALDECLSHRDIIETLKEIIAWKFDNVHILFTSRREQVFVEWLDPMLQTSQIVDLENGIVDQDIKMHVQDRLLYSKWKDDEDACKAIKSALGRSNGMFRWASLQMDAIEKCINKRSLHTTLDTLPQDLDETYERILLAIPAVNRAYAIRLLTWITYSRRPLSLDDLAEAAAIDPYHHDPVSDDDKLRSPLDILTLCQGLIGPIAANDHGRPRPTSQLEQEYALSHFSVQEYLESTRIRDSSAKAFALDRRKSHAFMTGACLTYSRQSQEEELEYSGLATYCIDTWDDHARAAEPIDQPVLKLIVDLLHTLSASTRKDESKGPLSAKAAHVLLLKYACEFGLPSLVRFLLETEHSRCPVGKRTRARITAATLKYHVYFATLLAVDVAGLLSCSYRLWANSERVNFVILSWWLTAQLLVFWHIAVESYIPKIRDSESILERAAGSGSIPVAQALLDAGEIPHWLFCDPEAPLMEAVTGNNVDMVRYLLDNYSYHRGVAKAFGRAIARPTLHSRCVDSETTLALLHSSQGAGAASKYIEEDWIALQGFTRSPDTEETRLALSELLAYTTKGSIHGTNRNGDTPLHLAVGQRCISLHRSLDPNSKAILLYLFKEGASPSAQNSLGATPLHLVLVGSIDRYVRNELLELFAMHRANPDAPDKQGRTLLHAIACSGDEITHAMKWFPHATLDQRDCEGNTPLHFAASRGNTDGGLALLRLGADATAKNHAGATPLHLICRLSSIWRYDEQTESWNARLDLKFPWGRSSPDSIGSTVPREDRARAFIKEMWQAGADIDALDEKGNSAIHWACLYWEPVQMLNIFRDLGSNINRLNSQGHTPLDFIADDCPGMMSEKRRRFPWENVDAMYIRKRAWLRDSGGRTAEELKVS